MMSIEQVEKLRVQGAAPAAASAPAPAQKSPWDDEATRAAPPMDSKPEWFAMVKGKQAGPFDPRGIAELVRSGDVSVKSYLWRKGMAEWKRGADIPELAMVFAGGSPAAAAPEPAPAPRTSKRAAPPPAVEAVPSASPVELPFDTEPEPADPTASQIKKAMDFGELFSDADLPETPAPEVASPKRKSPEADPFAALGELDPAMVPEPGEATRFFIAQAGVNKRNPPWKIAAFVIGGIAVPVGILFLLSTFNVVPLKVKTVDASGKEVEQSVFSAGGVSSLGDLLLGKGNNASAPAAPTKMAAKGAQEKGAEKAPASGANMPKVAPAPTAHVATRDELAALYGDTSKTDKGPKLRKDTETQTTDTSSGGLEAEEIAKVVQQSQSAFQSCIEQELRKNPNLKVPRFYLNATVASSGVVKATSISEHSVDSSPLGECLKLRAKRMTFSHFAGDDVEVQIPLIVGISM